jgi:DNA-binding response OmpR family regulator
MAVSVLIIENDPDWADSLRKQLSAETYRVLLARDGVEGLALCEQERPDLVLLAILLPRMDGWETCRRIRETSDVPIIIISHRCSDLDKARGLELGADDYLSKPYSPVELIARIRAALRRSRNAIVNDDHIRIDNRLSIDRAGRQVLVDGQPCALSALEYKLLLSLVENAGRILTHQSLLTQVWGWEFADETDYLKVYVHTLRSKIEPDPKHPRYIVTVRGLGYRFQR